MSKETLLRTSEVVVVGAPHSAYRTLVVPPGLDVVDIWGILPK